MSSPDLFPLDNTDSLLIVDATTLTDGSFGVTGLPNEDDFVLYPFAWFSRIRLHLSGPVSYVVLMLPPLVECVN